MTILFFSRLFYPHGGGVETHVREIGRRLVQMGHSVTVITETYNTAYHSNSESARMTGEIDGIRIVRLDGGKEGFWKKVRIWLWLWQHRRLILEADIVHAHDVFFWYLPFRFLYPNKPAYTTFHGYETKFPPSKKAILWRKLSEKLSWGNVCVGEFIAKWYGTTPTYVTYGGVEILPIHTNNPINKSMKKSLKIVLMGRLEEDIGIRLYLQAIRKIKVTRDVDVTFLGDGSFKKSAQEFGTVTTFNEKFLGQADVVFASSYLSMLSAMAAKKPVVAVYTNPLKKDYLAMAPFSKFISVVNSADKIVAEVKNLDKTKEKVEKAYAWAKAQTWEKVVETYLQLWKI